MLPHDPPPRLWLTSIHQATGVKRFYIGICCLGLGIPILVGLRSSTKPGPAVSVHLYGVTNDAAGQPVAILSLTRHRLAAVLPDSFGHQVGSAWVWQTLPSNLVTEVSYTIGNAQDDHPTIGEVHFPTNSSWRLRIEVVEPRSGVRGLTERLKYPMGYYRRGGVLNVPLGFAPCRYTGKFYYVDTEEIR